MELVELLSQVVAQYGFPIACVCYCFWNDKYKYDKGREDTKENQKITTDMLNKYGELSNAINTNTESINNLTKVVLNLVGKADGKNE